MAAGLGELPPQIALCLTDRRLLVFKRGGLSGKAKELVAAIPRDVIVSIQAEPSGSRLTPDRLTVALADGRQVVFEVVTSDDHDGLVAAFRS